MQKILHTSEFLSLFGLTIIPSSDTIYELHKIFTILWAIFQQIKMVTHLFLWHNVKHHPLPETASLAWKIKLSNFCYNFISLVLIGILYNVHVFFCVQYVYSCLSVLEYGLVVSNIFFNGSSYFDFPETMSFVVFENLSDMDRSQQ